MGRLKGAAAWAAVVVVMSAGVALAQSTDPTAAFGARVTQAETYTSMIGAGVLGIIDMWILITGAMQGRLNWVWLIMVTIVAVIVGSYSQWKPLLIG